MTYDTVLPGAMSRYAKAIDEAAGRFDPLPVPVGELWNPETCPEHMLPWLAVSLSVDLWRPEWPVWRKRKACRDALQNARLKGTLAGMERYLAQVDAEVVSVTTPPVKAFAGKSYTKEELDRFYGVMPQLRIYPNRNRNRDVFGRVFAGTGCGPGRFAFPSVATTGRRAFIFDPLDDSLTALTAIQLEERNETRGAVERTRVVKAGEPGDAMFAGGFANRAAGVVAKRSTVYTVDVNSDYIHSESRLRVSTIAPSFQPLDIRYERGSDIWRGRPGKAYAGLGAGRFASPSDAWLHGFAYVRLYDPARTPALRHGSRHFAGDRIGIPAHTAHVRIKINIPHRRGTAFAGHFAGRAFARPVDTSVRDAALEAVHVAKSAEQKILVTFQNWRVPTFGDAVRLGDGRRFSDLIPRSA